MDILYHFFLATFISFLGYLPFGLVNLSVIDNSLRNGFQSSLKMSMGAGLVEIAECLIAVQFTVWISSLLEHNFMIELFIFILLLVFGLYFLLKGTDTQESSSDNGNGKKSRGFIKGLVLSILNPQAIPFWVFVVTWFQNQQWVRLNNWNLIAFVAGGASGRFLSLALYSYLSVTVIQETQKLNQMMNKIIGSILIVLSFIEGVQLITSY